jgi:predicted Zn-dependent protease
MTVRHPKGTGSGWAGQSGYDWTAINGPALAERALQKCLASIDPVRIEPGRYTVILEPQAVADLIRALVPGALDREDAEVYRSGPFVLGVDEGLMLIRTKLGLKVIDERITISHNPSDPELGVMNANGLEPLTWIERGVLKTLNYNRAYALPWLNDNTGAWMRESFRMSGGNTPIEEMISTTKRGILVTRLSNMLTLERNSLLATGVTRDGLWLIEHGKVSKAINNLRLTDSPLFMLNQVEQLGVPVPVFRPVRNASWVALTPAIVPPIKANDFSFTALVDAV